MPALTDIHLRINSDSVWQSAFDLSSAKARVIADNICLIHVSGHYIPFNKLLVSDVYLPLSDEASGYCSPLTREAEDTLGLNRSLYFYAGRACPEFGPIALAFPAEVEKGHTGSATPYDTGGFYKRYIKWKHSAGHDSVLKTFTGNSLFTLDQWRDAFYQYLGAYFFPLQSYWSGRPWKKDLEGLFDPPNEWRAWIFEVRFHEKQSILKAEAWCSGQEQSEMLWDAVENMPAAGSMKSPVEQFLESVVEIPHTPYYCEEIELWVRGKMGI